MGLPGFCDLNAWGDHRGARGLERRRGVSRAVGSSPAEHCRPTSSSPKKNGRAMRFVDDSHINGVYQRHIEPTTGQETNSNRTYYAYIYISKQRSTLVMGHVCVFRCRNGGKLRLTDKSRRLSLVREKEIYIYIVNTGIYIH